MAELALLAPFLVLLTLGMLELAALAYAGAMARFAAFAGLRAAAVRGAANRDPAVTAAAADVIGRAPGLALVAAHAFRMPLHVAAVGASTDRLACDVIVRAPRISPIPGPRTVHARAVMPMEPAW